MRPPRIGLTRRKVLQSGMFAGMVLVIRSGRVRAGYRIGESMFRSREGRMQILHIVGERPGSGHRTHGT